MQNRYSAQIKEIVSAIEITSWSSFSLAGQPFQKIKKEVVEEFTPKMRQEYFIYNLQQQLYQHCYCRKIGTALPAVQNIGNRGKIQSFIMALSEANSGTGHWETGWEVIEIEKNGRIAANKQGLTLYLWPGQYHYAEPNVEIGMKVKIRVGKECTELNPGFYMALGNALEDEDDIQILRLYWNSSADSAVKLMKFITDNLNNIGLAFKFKTVKDPSSYSRRDSSVLYFNKKDYEKIQEIIKRIYAEINEDLGNDTPLFTKELAPGLGLAEDPANGQSFGEHRCHLVAEGLYNVYKKKLKSIDERVKEVIQCFENNGISIQFPYINSGSDDIYKLSL